MKTVKILSILTGILLFSQCGSAQFEQNPPFTINSAIYNNWSGGQEGSRGMNVNITYSALSPVKFDSIYFNKKAVKLEIIKTKDTKLLTANFVSDVKRDIILDKNSSKEIKNNVPEIKSFPFDLKQNEAIISYKVKDKIKYFKITSIKKGKSIFYPSAPKQQ